MKKRVIGLDIFRGWALLFMIFYHFTFDLNYFGFIHVDMNHEPLFQLSRYTIMSMFLLSVGISLALIHQSKIRWHSVKKRLFQLGLASTLVSLATYFVFPNSWIYFGILHFILVASLFALPFLKYPKIALITALLILIGTAMKLLHTHGIFTFLQPLLHLPPLYSEDLVPLVPWFAVVLLGTVMVYYQLHEKVFTLSFFTNHNRLNKLLKFMGQHSLLIYLMHQVLLFLGFELFLMLFSK
jgi:uncharacterized membrane protein